VNDKQKPTLHLEVLNGPLDGATVALSQATEWTAAGQGPLSLPWDEELGQPQAHFRPDENGWTLTGQKVAHGTYRVNTDEKVTASVPLESGDLLKASGTWLLVR
jgi:hypothetical protein